MSVELLSTKLHAPPARKNLVPRPRLGQKLNARLERKLTLVSAPPGFGKTTLMAHCIQQVDIPTAWVSLDETDNELFRFAPADERYGWLLPILGSMTGTFDHQTYVHRYRVFAQVDE